MRDGRIDGPPLSAWFDRRDFLRLAAFGSVARTVPSTASALQTGWGPWAGSQGWDAFFDVLGTADDGYLLVGIRTVEFEGQSENVGWAVKLDAQRTEQWNRTYVSPKHAELREEGYPGEGHDGFEFAVHHGVGGYLLCGWYHNEGPDDRYGWIISVDSGGSVQWQRTYQRADVNSFHDSIADGVPTPDGGYLLAGRTLGSEFLDERHGDGRLLKIDADGDVLWDRAYNTLEETTNDFSDDPRHDEFNAISMVSTDRFVLVGEASPDGPSDSTYSAGWIVVVDNEGNEVWSDTYRLIDGADNEFADVVPADDGGYVVVGVAGTDELVRPANQYETVGDGIAMKVDSGGGVVWEEAPVGDGFRSVFRRSARDGYLLAGARDSRGWIVTIDEEGTLTTQESTAEAPESVFTSMLEVGDDIVAAGRGRNARTGSIDGLAEFLTGSEIEQTSDSTRFDPDVNGFRFTNWPTGIDLWDPPHNHDYRSPEEIRSVVQNTWKEPLRDQFGIDIEGVGEAFIDGLVKKIYVSVNQGSATNGHCFGMVFAARDYYLNEGSIPTEADKPSEIPTPVGRYSAIGDDIDRHHNQQFLTADMAWKTFTLRNPTIHDLRIDYNELLRSLKSTLDKSGVAAVALSSTGSGGAHQILVYDYEETNYETRFKVYDPDRGGYNPTAIAVSPETEIIWTWVGTPFSVTADATPDGVSLFDSGVSQQFDTTYTQTLATPGAYLYHSTPFEPSSRLDIGMRGGILVVDEETTATSPPNEERRELRNHLSRFPAAINYDYSIEDLTGQETVNIEVGRWEPPDIRFDTSGNTPTPIGALYRGMTGSEYDRMMLIDESEADPTTFFVGGTQAVASFFENFFSGIAAFFVKSPVSLHVDGPDGEPLHRDSTPFTDLSATDYEDMLYQFGELSGEYRATLIGEDSGEYTLEAYAASSDGKILDERFTGMIEQGERHEFQATVPDSPTEQGSLERVSIREAGEESADSLDSGGLLDWLPTAGDIPEWAPAVGGAGAIGAGIYAYLRRHSGDDEDGRDPSSKE